MEEQNVNRQLPLWSFGFKSSSRVEVLTRMDIESRLVAKALKNGEFKNELLKNGRATIEQLFAIELPDALTVHIVEETDLLVYLVLPHNPYAGIAESELITALGMDLEDIAGWVLNQQKGLFPEDSQKNVRLVTNAWRDAFFKKQLLADPVFIIEQELGEEIQDGVTIQVLEETADEVYIVIPQALDHAFAQTEIETYSVNLPIIIGSDPSPNSSAYRCPLGMRLM